MALMKAEPREAASSGPCVAAVGMVSSVGLDAASTCAAVRARLSRFEELPFVDRFGTPIMGAPATEAVGGLQAHRRLAPLLAAAIRDCAENAAFLLGRARTLPPLLICTGHPSRPDHPPRTAERVTEEALEVLGASPCPDVRVFPEGAMGFFRGLEVARDLVARDAPDGCIVAGVDSLLNAKILAMLDEQERLKTDANSDGVIPGEAAAAVWVVSRGRLQRTQQSLAEIAAVGFGDEASARQPGAPNLAEGLATAMGSALGCLGMTLDDIAFRVAGVGGERAEFMEVSTATARLLRSRRETFDLLLPAEKLGDVGAAMGACAMVLTAVALSRGYAPGPTAMILMSDPGGPRVACIVRHPCREV